GHEQLVRHGIEERAEARHLVPPTGHGAIQPVCERGGHEDHRGDEHPHAIGGDGEDDDEGDENDPEERQGDGKIDGKAHHVAPDPERRPARVSAASPAQVKEWAPRTTTPATSSGTSVSTSRRTHASRSAARPRRRSPPAPPPPP